MLKWSHYICCSIKIEILFHELLLISIHLLKSSFHCNKRLYREKWKTSTVSKHKSRGRIPGAEKSLPYDTGVPLIHCVNTPRLNPNREIPAQFWSDHGDMQDTHPMSWLLAPCRISEGSQGSRRAPYTALPGGGGNDSFYFPAHWGCLQSGAPTVHTNDFLISVTVTLGESETPVQTSGVILFWVITVDFLKA